MVGDEKQALMQPFSLEKPVAHSTASKFSAVLIGVLTLVEYITLWIHRVKVQQPTWHKIGHFEDALSSHHILTSTEKNQNRAKEQQTTQ